MTSRRDFGHYQLHRICLRLFKMFYIGEKPENRPLLLIADISYTTILNATMPQLDKQFRKLIPVILDIQ